MTVFIKSNIAIFGQNAGFSKKKFFICSKYQADLQNEELKDIILKQKSLPNPMVLHF